MQQQLITDWLQRNQATVSENGELSMPDYAGQLAAVTDGIAYSWLSKFSILRVSGDDATTFLQGQFSCDVAAVAENGVSWGSYSTAKGRMQASFLLFGSAGVFHLLLRNDIAETFRKRLSMFVLRSKVKIECVDSSMLAFGVMQATACHGVLPQRELQCDENLVAAISPNVSIVLTEDPASELAKWQTKHRAVGSQAWDWVFIQAGLPWVSKATYEEFVPQMANLDLLGGVSFKKGCYPGQEIVARTQYLGKVKRRLYRARISGGHVNEGDALLAASTGEQAIGRIVLTVPLLDGENECLLVMQAMAWDDNPKLASGVLAKIEQLPLPYSFPDAD
ncbi:YgfZ/GcvT domain-containing protein [Vogesella oryzae]|uniref:CAF17-like 4Fe-4S cluster assembly/insertion protein YgfZ n=1 Tax=Vogesella oryzae TaxID=1735285 RepID=UPI001582A170|nr:folate-binding protein YgfZ [Vogesella oryzae]